jgi:glycosyltransferase involved in cell wall biosynthesis
MRFLIVTQYFSPEIGASQVRLGAVAKALVAKGHDVEVITALPNHPTGKIFPEYRGRLYVRETWNGCSILRVWLYPALGIGLRRMLNYISFAVMLFIPLSRAKKPQVLLVESPPPFLMGAVAFYNLFWRAKLILNVADLWPDSATEIGLMREGILVKLMRIVEHWCYRRANYINSVTMGIKDALINKKQIPDNKILFFPNGADTDTFYQREPDSELIEELSLVGKKIILYAGTIGYAHGLEVAIGAMALLEKSRKECHLVIIGDGSERSKLLDLVRNKKLENISFISPHPPTYIARLYSIATAGLSTLKPLPFFEGTRPSKIFSIMASGKPVIYSGAGEGARLVNEAQAGIVTTPGDSHALAEAIIVLIENSDEAERYGRNGREYIQNNLSWEKLIDRWLTELTIS